MLNKVGGNKKLDKLLRIFHFYIASSFLEAWSSYSKGLSEFGITEKITYLSFKSHILL